MIFLHDSVKTNFFKGNKKLELLKNGVITMAQFINLIEPKDDFILIGPAIVAKSSVNEFLTEWRMHQLNVDSIKDAKNVEMPQDEIISHFDELQQVFPEITPFVTEFREQLKSALCPKCTKTKFIEMIVEKVNSLKDDGRDTSSIDEFLHDLIRQFYEVDERLNPENVFSEYDIEWLKPERLVGLGVDLIKNLPNCFECTIKHIGRAKILYEEFKTGYPDHKKMMFDELDKGEAILQDAYTVYMDSVAQLDMASCELIGNVLDLPTNWQVDMIELANKIRGARLLYQEDPTRPPDFDALRLEVKKLEIKTEKTLAENAASV